jgi:hypothetical protein
VLDACLDSLRAAARSVDPAAAKLQWNRIKLYLWPALDIPLAELETVVRMLAPRAEGLGLEQALVQFRLAETRDDGCRAHHSCHRPADRPAARVGRLRTEGDQGVSTRRDVPLRADPHDHPLCRPETGVADHLHRV